MSDKNPQVGIGLDTILEFERPVKVRFETHNLIPLQHLDYAVVGEKPVDIGEVDFESEPIPDQMAYGSLEPYKIVEVNASALVVATHKIGDIEFWTFVNRIEGHNVPHYLKINPGWVVDNLPLLITHLEQEAIEHHHSLVTQVRTLYEASNPKIIYQGEYLLEARFKGR